MKNLIYALALFWFFGVRSAYDPDFPKVTINTVIGPFETQIECNRERTKFAEYIAANTENPIIVVKCQSIEKS